MEYPAITNARPVLALYFFRRGHVCSCCSRKQVRVLEVPRRLLHGHHYFWLLVHLDFRAGDEKTVNIGKAYEKTTKKAASCSSSISNGSHDFCVCKGVHSR